MTAVNCPAAEDAPDSADSAGAEREARAWASSFRLDPSLVGPVAAVAAALPEAVRRDLLDDPNFVLSDYEHGTAGSVPVGSPSAGRPGRAVALRRSLSGRPWAFVHWLIAHEFAHAHLRNAGRHPGEDPERAADALAAEWGFPRPG